MLKLLFDDDDLPMMSVAVADLNPNPQTSSQFQCDPPSDFPVPENSREEARTSVNIPIPDQNPQVIGSRNRTFLARQGELTFRGSAGFILVNEVGMCDNQNQNSTNHPNAMPSTSNNGVGGGKNMPGDGSLINGNQQSGQQFGTGLAGTSILQSQLNAPPQQQQNLSPGQMQNAMSHFHGQNLGTGMDQPLAHHMHHHPMQQHPFSSHLQHHLMEGQHSQQMNLSQQLPPAPPFNISPHHNQHAHHQQQQYMPFGMHNNNFGSAGNPYSNMANPQLNPFLPHHIPNPQQGHPMQQAGCFAPHGSLPCMLNYQQQQSPAGQRASGWMGPSGLAPSNIPTCANNRARNRNKMNQYLSSPPPSTIKVLTSGTRAPTPVNSDPNALPGGLDILWRELHPDCQKFMMQQDIPDTAKLRGYFTVCELLSLKRTLQGRFAGGAKPSGPVIMPVDVAKIVGPPALKEETKRGQKRGHGNAKSSGKAPKVKRQEKDGKKKMSQLQQQLLEGDGNQHQVNSEMETMQQTRDNGSVSTMEDPLNDLERPNEGRVPIPTAVAEVEVSGVVKAAMETLTFHQDQNFNNGGGEASGSTVGENSLETQASTGGDRESMDGMQCDNLDTQSTSNCDALNGCTSGRAEHVAEHSTISLPQFADFATSSQCLGNSVCDGMGNERNNMKAEANSPILHAITTSATSTISSNIDALINAVNSLPPAGIPHAQHPYRSQLGYPLGPPPPTTHRTLSLVLKLLQFGQYQIRSFSLNNPNKLKVLFNSQRITYECQLPLMQQPTEGSGPPQAMRKILNVDISFDQISSLKFTSDALCMRVEGAPLLQLSFNPVQEKAEDEPSLTQNDIMILDQIEKGQLKLHPIHQLFFLNERLVGLLETQCREHPRLGRLFQDYN